MDKCFYRFFIIARYIIFLAIISFTGCEYHTDKEFVNDIKQPDNADYTIVLNPSDSVYYIGKHSYFVCEGLSDEVRVYNIRVYVDDSIVADINDPRCMFFINGENYTEGHHVLTIVATTSSGSGSLADILSSEGFLFTFKWDLIVDHSPPTGAVQITNIFNDDGILRIEWEKYKHPNFKYYELFKTVIDKYGNSHRNFLGVVFDQSQNYFPDESYIGGKAIYEVVVGTPFDQTAISDTASFIDDEISMNIEWLGEDLLRFSWPSLKYPKAFNSRSIEIGNKLIYYSKSVDTNSVTLHAGIIGKKSSVTFVIETKSPTAYFRYQYYSINEYCLGLPMMKFNSFFKNNVNKSVYLATNDKLYRFDTEVRELMDSVLLADSYDQFVLSPDNKILVSTRSTRKYNPDQLSDNQKIDVLYPDLGSISNNSLGIAKQVLNYVLYDFLNLKAISAFPEITYGQDIFITEDSKFFLQSQNGNHRLGCYKIENGLWIEYWVLPMNSYSLIPGEPEKVMLINNNICEIRNIETKQVLKSFDVVANTIYGVDPTTETVMLLMPYPGGGLNIYNYHTGELLRTMQSSYDSRLYYYRSAIYSSDGTIVPLNF